MQVSAEYCSERNKTTSIEIEPVGATLVEVSLLSKLSIQDLELVQLAISLSAVLNLLQRVVHYQRYGGTITNELR